MKRKVAFGILVLGFGTAAASCEKKEAPGDVAAEPARDTLATAAPGVRTYLDSANAAYSKQSYEAARGYYLKVTELDSALSAGWFGVYMAESKLGNKAAADAAIARARKEGGS